MVPATDTAAYRDDSGELVKGPAAVGEQGSPAVVVSAPSSVNDELYHRGGYVTGGNDAVEDGAEGGA